VKRYSSEKEATEDGNWRPTRVVLSPLNPDYEPIVVSPDEAESIEILAEFITVLSGAM
jgi:SOS-response transcriptional repressor LexA